MFGLITRRELEKILDARDKELARASEEMAFEWSRWFDKFRSLYAQWTNRDKKHSKDGAGATNSPDGDDGEGAGAQAVGPLPFRSRRQF